MGTKAKGQIDEHTNKTEQRAAVFKTGLDNESQKLSQVEDHISTALYRKSSLTELVEVLHKESSTLDVIKLPVTDSFNVQRQTVKFIGRYSTINFLPKNCELRCMHITRADPGCILGIHG